MKLRNGDIVKFKPQLRETQSKFFNRLGKVVNMHNGDQTSFDVAMLDEPNDRPWFFTICQTVDFDVITEVYNSPLWKAMNED